MNISYMLLCYPLRLTFARANMPLACLPPIREAVVTNAVIIYIS